MLEVKEQLIQTIRFIMLPDNAVDNQRMIQTKIKSRICKHKNDDYNSSAVLEVVFIERPATTMMICFICLCENVIVWSTVLHISYREFFKIEKVMAYNAWH